MAKIKRHGWPVRFVHWTVALSTLALIFTGFGQMPMYKRYMIDQLPGMAWTSNYTVTLTGHYIFAVILIFAVTYHIVFHIIRKEYDILPRKGDFKESYLIIKAMLTGGKEPENDKYLAEQRLAYAYIGVMLLVLIVTGVIKVIKNLPMVTLDTNTLIVVANIHNLATVLLIVGIAGHLIAFAFKANRPLLPGIFNGKIDREYAKHRHSIWYQRMEKTKSSVSEN